MRSQVAILRTRPETVVADYGRLMRLVKYDQALPRDQDLIVKLNLSWTKYFPACSSQPWQVDGVLTTLLDDGYDRTRVVAVENKTVVTDPRAGCRNNKWEAVLRRHGVPFLPLPDVPWTVHRFSAPLLKLNDIFPEGIEIPAMYVGKNVLHCPTVKCVHPDTEVVLADGALVAAEALVKEWHVRAPTARCSDGDEVAEGRVCVMSWSRFGVTGGHATQFWRSPVTDGTMWSIRTRTGRAVITSSRHPFLTPEGWVRASDLRVGDRVAVVRRVRVAGRSQCLPSVSARGHESVHVDGIAFRPGPATTSPDFWRWVGYFTAGGSADDASGSYRLSLTNTDPDVRADYIDLSRRLFGVEPRARGGEIYFDASNRQPFFQSLGFTVPTNSATKAVPDVLFKCPDEEIAAFLQAYFDGDGTVDARTGVYATTKSRRLASQVQTLLSRLGVMAFVRTPRARATNGRMTRNAPYEQLGIHGDDVAELARHIRFRCRDKHARLESLVARRHAGGRLERGDGDDDIAWDRVDDVRSEPADVPFFYDLSVEGTQSFVGNGFILHNTHGHTVTTGAIKNSFGGLLKEVRHYAHEFIHEVMVDLMYMQRELHPSVVCVMDGTVMGDGAGPRTMVPRVGNVLLASSDQVAIDAIAARLMGFDPLSIRYLAMCHERALGVADPRDIELVGDVEASAMGRRFRTSRSLVIWGDQLIRRGPLRPLKRLLLHSPLAVWAPFASNVYHDLLWYPTVGRWRMRAFAATPWGRLFERY